MSQVNYDWYKIINLEEFEDEELVSKEVELNLEGKGTKTVLVTKGNAVSIQIDDAFLTVNLNSRNPFEFENMACYLDDNDDIWVGFAVEN